MNGIEVPLTTPASKVGEPSPVDLPGGGSDGVGHELSRRLRELPFAVRLPDSGHAANLNKPGSGCLSIPRSCDSRSFLAGRSRGCPTRRSSRVATRQGEIREKWNCPNVRELSGNFVKRSENVREICHFRPVRELSGNFIQGSKCQGIVREFCHKDPFLFRFAVNELLKPYIFCALRTYFFILFLQFSIVGPFQKVIFGWNNFFMHDPVRSEKWPTFGVHAEM